MQPGSPTTSFPSLKTGIAAIVGRLIECALSLSLIFVFGRSVLGVLPLHEVLIPCLCMYRSIISHHIA